MRIPIVFSTDHNFVMPTGVTIHSLLRWKKPEVNYDIFILTNPDVTDKDKESLENQVKNDDHNSKISFIDIGDTFKGGYEIRDISKACYNRLMIPWLLPQYDKIIYSDVDIIFKGDLSDVYDTDMKDYLVAGVGGEVWEKWIFKRYLQKIGVKSKEYINSGFLLINSALQRDKNLKEEYLQLSKKEFLYQDQDIINLVCKGHISHLPESYNIKPSDIYNFPLKEIKVIHYKGIKPWHGFTFGWEEWWQSYNDSLFYNPKFAKSASTRILKWNHIIHQEIKANCQKAHFVRKCLLGKF